MDFQLIWGNGILIIISHNYNLRGMQKYLIVYKTNIMLHFLGVRQIGSVHENLLQQQEVEVEK